MLRKALCRTCMVSHCMLLQPEPERLRATPTENTLNFAVSYAPNFQLGFFAKFLVVHTEFDENHRCLCGHGVKSFVHGSARSQIEGSAEKAAHERSHMMQHSCMLLCVVYTCAHVQLHGIEARRAFRFQGGAEESMKTSPFARK